MDGAKVVTGATVFDANAWVSVAFFACALGDAILA
jgi:hypothetical protein